LGALAQDSKLDSLLKALPHSRDTMKVNVLNQISKRYWYADPPKARQYAGEALKLSRTIRFGKGEALAYNNMGIGYYLQNDYSNALKYFTESIKANQVLGNQKGMGDTYNNMGLISIKQSNYPQALDYYLLSLKDL
jgi:tetratricopeptide (TPR) repeat protein